MGVPPFEATFALEKREAIGLAPLAYEAVVAWLEGIAEVQFGVVYLMQDVHREEAEACLLLSFDLHVGAGFGGPVGKEVSDRAKVATSLVAVGVISEG